MTLGLYIHIPFCRQKCFYCDFFSVSYDETLAQKYVKAIISHGKKYPNKALDTIYIGGGTPSVLTPNQIEILLKGVVANFDVSRIKEFTFEVNPESLSKEKLQILKEYGVNRLSMGLQSSNDKDLKMLGRVHDFKTFENSFKLARKFNFQNINLDLIYGLTSQTAKDFKQVLQTVLLFDTEHISLYPLTIEPGTKFYNDNIKTDDSIQKEIYEMSVRILNDNGYNHYEISNWSKENKQSLHNSNYWRNKNYLALGAGASGYYNHTRYKNISNILKYIQNQTLLDESENIDIITQETEAIILGLRLLNEGVSLKTFTTISHRNALQELLDKQMLVVKDGRVKMKEEYVFVGNSILSHFVGNCERNL